MTKHILSIDDEVDIRELLQEILTLRGYRVSIAGNAEEARRIVKSDPPQLIISDLQMEDTDGFELIEELKTVLPEVPVLLLTGVIFDPEVVRDTIRTKVSSYLDKTASLDDILNEVERLLQGPVPSPSVPK
jgi:DNA-binding NtrC family response regulator